MLKQHILPPEVAAERSRISVYLKKCRETFLITQEELGLETKLGRQAIRRMENSGKIKDHYTWTIDSQIRYILGVLKLAKQKKYYEHRVKMYPDCSEQEMRKLLNQRQ